jgi:hypothetical protein
MKKMLLMVWVGLSLASCTAQAPEESKEPLTIDQVAERYVRTVLRLGLYDKDIVDAYYGPEEWKPQGAAYDSLPLQDFLTEFNFLQQELEKLHEEGFSVREQSRLRMLKKQLRAAKTKAEMMGGKRYSFDEEARLLYDVVPPHFSMAHFDSLLAQVEAELPGTGSVAERWQAYRKQFVIPKEKLDTVFQAAIQEARRRTKAHYQLPENENFRVEYVTDKPWSGYNYYQGKGYSLIQINTDFPINIERAIDLASHEGYPGHHVYNALLEKKLVDELGWVEYSLYPLFSPQSLIAEGSANYGIKVAFPAEERLQFEKEVLFPLAGLDTAEADRYYQLLDMIARLDYAGNEAARRYLDGEISRQEAADILVKYNFYEPEKALQRTRFIDRYRSYVINYNLGRDLVAEYVERQGGTANAPEQRWDVFEEILSRPFSASMLKE